MRETNTSSKLKVKQFLAWMLSLQIAGVAYVVPAYFFISNAAYAGDTGPKTPVIPDAAIGSEGEKNPNSGYMQQYPKENHSGNAPAKSKRQPICQEADGSIKRGCKIAGWALLGIAAIIAIVLLTRKKKGRASGGGNGGRPVRPGKPGRPTERPRPEGPEPERPPVVPCCQNPAPAPAPEGGGTSQTSTITTGNTLPAGVTPVVVNPTE